MDGDRFDDITRVVVSGFSRRRVLGGIGAALLGALGVRHDALATGQRGCTSTSCTLPRGADRSCTTAYCYQGKYCKYSVRTGISCSDGNPCTINDRCEAKWVDGKQVGVCRGTRKCGRRQTCDRSTGMCVDLPCDPPCEVPSGVDQRCNEAVCVRGRCTTQFKPGICEEREGCTIHRCRRQMVNGRNVGVCTEEQVQCPDNSPCDDETGCPTQDVPDSGEVSGQQRRPSRQSRRRRR